MLLTISTTHKPATDLGYLLHKNPSRSQSFEMCFGQVYVFYPEATEELCTAALLLDVDPVGMVRGGVRFRSGLPEAVAVQPVEDGIQEIVAENPQAGACLAGETTGPGSGPADFHR